MKKYILKNTIVTCMLVLFIGSIHAQTKVILDETLLTQASFNKFTAVSVKGGAHAWNFSSDYGAMMSGYTNPYSYENEDWFISPAMDLTSVSNVTLTFDHARGNAPVMHVGMTEGWYKVFATANYTGNPNTTTWLELEGVNHGTIAWQFVSSGELVLPEHVKSANSRIAFKYQSSDTESATWEIKNVLVVGDELLSPPDSEVFKFTTFNAEWLSCPTTGPDDDDLQMNNLASLITTINPDVIALQEVGTSNHYATVDTLVKILGSDIWAGSIVPTGYTPYSNCGQYAAIVYKKSRVQLVSASALTSNAESPEGFTYHYCWANGRYPIKYEMNLSTLGGVERVIFINVHAKAMSDETSYLRRKGGSYLLKEILDGSAYNTKNIVFIGDFNDYLNGTMTSSQSQSPYYNFISDATNYMGLTGHIKAVNYNNPTIDNIIISNELFDNYIPGSAEMEIDASNTIPNFDVTTSNNHRPISASFSFGSATQQESQTIAWEQILGTVFTNNAPISLTAMASSGLPVNYSSSNTGVATVSGATLHIVGAGQAKITASQAGNSTYSAAPNVQKIITVSGTGTVSVISNNDQYGFVAGSGAYDIGTTATIMAVAKAGNTFVGWTDNNTDNPRNLVVSGNIDVTANFSSLALETAQLQAQIAALQSQKNNLEAEVTSLWDDKNSLLDQIVFLNGLIVELQQDLDDCRVSGVSRINTPSLSFYPNPAKTELFISYEGDIKKVEVFSVTGQLMLSDDNFNEKINVQELISGTYFVRILTEEGLAVGRFVKE